eukprot:TRINITY_DN36838_c0_g1_i1.p1 TRINITY_DN36838_c0_g1~~TRINITY_DN36838_c0_g1_i1.p1  ORF type:complete len:361 (+),score=48.42 TRINITY_DN36838_c0_g1_i1:59-1141(+)
MSGSPRPPSGKKSQPKRNHSTTGVTRTRSRLGASLVESPSSNIGLGNVKEPGGWLYNQRVATGQTAMVNATLKLPENDPALERVFNTHQRIFPFSQRALHSIRHPFVRHAVIDHLQGGSHSYPPLQAARRGRFNSPRSDDGPATLFQRLKPKNIQQAQAEERKWTEVAHLFDVIALEDELIDRRNALISNSQLIRQIDRIWSMAVPLKQVTMSKSTYLDINCQIWRTFVSKHTDHSTDLFNIITQSGESDWATDSHPTGGTGVTYGDFVVSMFEVADNWAVSSTPSSYRECMTTAADGAVKLLSPPPPPPEMTWSDKKKNIHRNYNSGLFDSCVPQSLGKVRPRDVTNLSEYYLEPLPKE